MELSSQRVTKDGLRFSGLVNRLKASTLPDLLCRQANAGFSSYGNRISVRRKNQLRRAGSHSQSPARRLCSGHPTREPSRESHRLGPGQRKMDRSVCLIHTMPVGFDRSRAETRRQRRLTRVLPDMYFWKVLGRGRQKLENRNDC